MKISDIMSLMEQVCDSVHEAMRLERRALEVGQEIRVEVTQHQEDEPWSVTMNLQLDEDGYVGACSEIRLSEGTEDELQDIGILAGGMLNILLASKKRRAVTKGGLVRVKRGVTKTWGAGSECMEMIMDSRFYLGGVWIFEIVEGG